MTESQRASYSGELKPKSEGSHFPQGLLLNGGFKREHSIERKTVWGGRVWAVPSGRADWCPNMTSDDEMDQTRPAEMLPPQKRPPSAPRLPHTNISQNATSPGVVKKLFPVSSIALSAVEQSPLPTSSTASLEPVLRSLSQKRQERQANARSTQHGLQTVFLSIIPTHWDRNIELVSILKTTGRSPGLFKSWIVTWTSNLKSCKDKIFQSWAQLKPAGQQADGPPAQLVPSCVMRKGKHSNGFNPILKYHVS